MGVGLTRDQKLSMDIIDRSIKHYAPERDDENLRLLKKSFEEILTREYRKYGGMIQ